MTPPRLPPPHTNGDVHPEVGLEQPAGSASEGRHTPAPAETYPSDDGHVASQRPFTQYCPVAQAFPHAPQFAGWLRTSTQDVPHICCGATHPSLATQRPSMHCWLIAQALLHAPQWRWLV